MKSSIVRDKSYAFALRIITLARWLKEQKEFEIAGQILRSGTTIGANVEEALAGISRADFVAKISSPPKKREKLIIGCVCCAIPKLFRMQKLNL
jgi:hypothetical protein